MDKRTETFIRKSGSLADQKPSLLEDWAYDRNSKPPQEYAANSSSKVWWRCHKCGYEWEARIGNRYNGRGCPCCSHKKLVSGKNDFETTHPQLAKEWHPTKNGTLTPKDVMFGQARKVWWLCPHGHAYQASLNHRTGIKGTNCPVCNNGRQTSFREQAFYFYLSQIFPNVISRFTADWLGRFELDVYLPSIKTALEYDGVAWHKKDNFDRERKKYDLCHEHGIKLIRVKEKMPESDDSFGLADEIYSIEDLERKDNFERLLREVIDRLDPRSNMWTRETVHQIHSPIDIDLQRDRYAIIKTATKVNGSLEEEYPNIAKEWHPTKNATLLPSMLKYGSNFKAWWICPTCGTEYESSIAHRVSGTGCPKCAQAKAAATHRKNHLRKVGGITNSKLLAEWNYEKNGDLKPQDFPPQSEAKVWWKCPKCEYEWKAKINNRQNGRGCPYCSNKVVVKGKNDLATMHPELIKEWHYVRNGELNPYEVVPGSGRRVWWKCSVCGYEWEAPICRRSQGAGCRKCADRNMWKIRREKRLAILRPLKRQDGAEPPAKAPVRQSWLARIWKRFLHAK